MYLGAHWKNRGSADRPTMDRFEKFSTFSHTKSELKRGLFYEKKLLTHVHIWGPTMRAVLDKWGCRPSGPNWTNFDVWEHFPVQNQNSKGYWLIYDMNRLKSIKSKHFFSKYNFWKKLPSHVIWAPCGGQFWTNGGVGQSAQTGLLTFKNIFLYKI